MFKNLKNRMKKRENEIIELKKIMTATLESGEQHHREMIKVLYLITQEQAEVIDKLDEMNQSRKAYNEAIGKLEQKSDDKDEKIKFLVQNNEELERRVKNFASISNKKFAFVEEIKKIKAEYQKRIDDLTNRLSEQKQQELITDKKKLKELESLKSKKAESSDYLTELSRITGSLEIIVEKIFFESPDITEEQAIILLRKVKNPIGKRRWRAATIRNRVETYLKKRNEILRVDLYRSTPIGDAPLNKESGEISATAEKLAEEKKVLMRRDLGKEPLERKDILLDAKRHPKKGRLLAVNKNVSIREPLWKDMQDSIMDGKWHVFLEVDKIIARHRHRQLSMKRMCEIRRAYLQFAKDDEYRTARDEKDYLLELKKTDGVNRFRFTRAGTEVKPGRMVEKKEGILGVEERPLRKGRILAVVNKDVSIREPFWNDMQNSIMDGKWHTYSEANIIIRKHGHRPLSMGRISHIRQAYFKFAGDEEYHTARDGKSYLFELKKTGWVNRFRFTPAREEAKPDERGETTIPKRKYKKRWNEQLLGKKVYNDIVKWIEKNTCYKDIIFFNNVIVKISQELNKKKGKIYNPKQMHKFIADMLNTFPDKAVNPAQHRINAYRLYFERDGHITYKDWMYTINNDNLVPKQKKENETVEEKIVKDKHADISFIDRLGM